MEQELIELCHIYSLDEGDTKEFSLCGDYRIFVVKKHGQVYGYHNRCPHAGWPLNLNPDKFLDVDKAFIQCANHMATFDITSGICVAGPCIGAGLTKAVLKIADNKIWFRT